MKIVIKIGSNIVSDHDRGLNTRRISSLASHIADVQDMGHQVVIVSSGAVAAGMRKLGLTSRPGEVKLKQAAATVGQSSLIWTYEKYFGKRGKKVAGVSPAVMEILMRHEFPGNVRELENLIEYCFVLCHEGLIDVQHLPEDFRPSGPSLAASREHVSRLKSAEADTIRATLAQKNGHLASTARELGISRTTLWRKMKRYAISADDYRS